MRHLTTEQMINGEQLTDKELDALSTHRLYQLFRKIRALSNHKRWGQRYRCCEVCKEFIGTDEEYEREVVKPSKPFAQYAERLKRKLHERPDQFSHRENKNGS